MEQKYDNNLQTISYCVWIFDHPLCNFDRPLTFPWTHSTTIDLTAIKHILSLNPSHGITWYHSEYHTKHNVYILFVKWEADC